MLRPFQPPITLSNSELPQKCTSISKKNTFAIVTQYLKSVNLEPMSGARWKQDLQISQIWVLMNQSKDKKEN